MKVSKLQRQFADKEKETATKPESSTKLNTWLESMTRSHSVLYSKLDYVWEIIC